MAITHAAARSARDLFRAFSRSLPLVLAAACSDSLVDAGAAPDAPPTAVSASVRGSKYRDTSRPAATGRSGTATLTALSVMGEGGLVELTLTSGGLSDPGSGRGEIARAQVKVIGADGELLATLNYQRIGRGSVTLQIPGVPPGATLQVQANIRGIDGRRTDVVTVTDSVRLSAELDVDLAAPAEGFVGVPTVVSALVTEQNGDLGVYATCQLFVDGTLEDATGAVWVDAGDAVSCAFAPTFDTVGEHQLQVVVTYDDGSGSTQVVDQAMVSAVYPWNVAYTATAEDLTTESFEVYEYTWTHPDGTHKAYTDSAGGGVRKQSLMVAASLDRAVVWPIEIRVQASTGGVQWLSESISSASVTPDALGVSCINRTLTDGSDFQLCSTATGSTFGYTVFGGRVTYRAWGWSRKWNGAGALIEEMTWNSGYEASDGGLNARPWSGDVSVGIDVDDQLGPFGAEPVIPLTPFEEREQTQAYSCSLDYYYWLDGNAMETCTAKFTRRFGVRGSVSD